MSGFALGLVLSAAVLHAAWNALVKSGGDRAVALAAISFANFAVGTIVVLLSAAPARQCWPFIIASAVLHYGYYAFLYYAYRFGDLSQVYPVARGIAPALVAVGAWLSVGEALPAQAIAGLSAISMGIMLLAIGRHAPSDRHALAFALGTGAIIAAYSVVDGIGVRLSGSPFGYIGWLSLLEFPVGVAVVGRRRWSRTGLDPREFARGLAGGLMSVTAYGTVIYANSIAHMAAVSAVRESSVIFASLIGVVVFGERPWRKRIVSAAIVAGGVIALAAAG